MAVPFPVDIVGGNLSFRYLSITTRLLLVAERSRQAAAVSFNIDASASAASRLTAMTRVFLTLRVLAADSLAHRRRSKRDSDLSWIRAGWTQDRCPHVQSSRQLSNLHLQDRERARCLGPVRRPLGSFDACASPTARLSSFRKTGRSRVCRGERPPSDHRADHTRARRTHCRYMRQQRPLTQCRIDSKSTGRSSTTLRAPTEFIWSRADVDASDYLNKSRRHSMRRSHVDGCIATTESIRRCIDSRGLQGAMGSRVSRAKHGYAGFSA